MEVELVVEAALAMAVEMDLVMEVVAALK